MSTLRFIHLDYSECDVKKLGKHYHAKYKQTVRSRANRNHFIKMYEVVEEQGIINEPKTPNVSLLKEVHQYFTTEEKEFSFNL